MMEQLIKPKSLAGFVRSLSGLFITKENPNGLSPKEMVFVTALLDLAGTSYITKDVKIELSDRFNQSMQVTVNYINKLKKKGVIREDDHLHSIFFTNKIIIQYGNE